MSTRPITFVVPDDDLSADPDLTFLGKSAQKLMQMHSKIEQRSETKGGEDGLAAVANTGSVPPYPPFAGLPDLPALGTLQATDQWVAWKYILRPDKKKPDKVPINPATGRFAKSDDPRTWGSYSAAAKRARHDGLPGVGFMFSPDDGLCGFDLDDCRDPDTGALTSLAVDVVGLKETYIEVSPSGCGLRGFSKGKPSKAGVSASVEIYGTGRYLTVTGHHLSDTPVSIEPAPKTLTLLRVHVDGARRPRETAPTVTAETVPETATNVAIVQAMLGSIDPDLRQPEWLRVVFGVLATGWECAVDKARDWSRGALHNKVAAKFEESAFSALVRSFKLDAGITVATLVHFARTNGYTGPGLLASDKLLNGVDPAGDTVADIANGRRFAAAVRGRLLWISDASEWLRWGRRRGWTSASREDVEGVAKEVAVQMRRVAAERWAQARPDDAAAKKALREAERTSQRKPLLDMIDMAKSEAGMFARLTDFDCDPMLLGVANGVLDLRSATILPYAAELRLSKRISVAYEPSATCPRFIAFLTRIIPDPDVQAFIQRFLGYCLTGSVGEQVWAFFHGSGANGKSVLVETIAWLLGDYARKIATEVLMDDPRGSRNRDPDILNLRGTRFVYASEVEEGQRLAAARIKDWTSGERLSARAPYSTKPVSFGPTFKLVLGGNHRPAISDASYGTWRRLALIPFAVTIPEQERDPDLAAKLRDEGAGILNWMLQGLDHYRKAGRLFRPSAVIAATADYQDEQDVLGQFLSECCDLGRTFKVSKAHLYAAYEGWCGANGQRPMTATRLTRQLGDRGLKRDRSKENYLDVQVKSHSLSELEDGKAQT